MAVRTEAGYAAVQYPAEGGERLWVGRHDTTGPWLVSRVEDVNVLPKPWLDEIMALIRILGRNPLRCLPGAVVTRDDEGHYRLHLTEFDSNDDPATALDIASGRTATHPVTVEVEQSAIPAWLLEPPNPPKPAIGKPAKGAPEGL